MVRGMTALGALQAINDQIDVIKANKKYKAAERRQNNVCPQLVAG